MEDNKQNISGDEAEEATHECLCGAQADEECPYCEKVCIPHQLGCSGWMCRHCLNEDSAKGGGFYET